jgi:ariadne-1
MEPTQVCLACHILSPVHLSEYHDVHFHQFILYHTGGYYKCNKFDPNSDANDQSDAARAKRELNRYLHYYKRFHSHAQAQDFAIKSVKATEARMILLQEQNSDTVWTDVEFLKAANRQLVECRKVLKYSYAFAYYLQDGDKKTRFEYHQEMLERFTENLSELSEKPIQDMNRAEVVNQVRKCEASDECNKF